ncbi:hypothetical protein NUU61_006529 [Penicillium alfredii]|uniref:Integral membrane protein n=1 Tax=Penicillium alfredii TaxID=1506179 RepID=A0A9W9F166_9EURO|nr:uncharacterized protein NUU61_006529 [Penicillium alfredii]KAJ5091659.1 hypothetical protein NUU61_006529 [Penicillium alfredii]
MPEQANLDGLVGGFEGSDLAVQVSMGVFVCMALYKAVELIPLIFMSFRHYRGLYFWSLFLSTVIGNIPTTIGALYFFAIGPVAAAMAISDFEFLFMVPGQFLRGILALIITTGITMFVLTTTTSYGSIYRQNPAWDTAYRIVERIQLLVFVAQETFISCLYIWKTLGLLQLNPGRRGSQRRSIMYQLLAINLVIIAMVAVLPVVEFVNWRYIQVTLKSAIYKC